MPLIEFHGEVVMYVTFRSFAITGLTLFAFAGHAASASPPFDPAQSQSFGELYKLAPRVLAAPAATADELAVLFDLQKGRIALPSDMSRFRAHLEHGEMTRALAAGRVPQLGTLLDWNLHALDLTAIDHTLLATNAARGHEQFGPHRTSRVLAIVHLAIFEAVNTIDERYQSYHGLRDVIVDDLHGHAGDGPDALSTADVNTAIAVAAHDALVALYPKKQDIVDAAEFTSLLNLGDGTDPDHMKPSHKVGYEVGAAAARAVLAERGYDRAATASSMVSTFSDGSSEIEPKASDPRFSGGPDRWHPDPIHPLSDTALGGNWMHVRPFVIQGASSMRPAHEPAGGSAVFVASFKDVKAEGGDPIPGLQSPRATTPSRRTPEETAVGDFWAYDGTALLCAPPRLYNEIATSVALHERPVTTVHEMARYLALVNLALADAGIAAWEAKYYYHLARPVTYIRALSIDASPAGSASAGWTPKGAPTSNGDATGRNVTPPFPSYPSGHAVFGGALFQVMRSFWSTRGSDEAFSFMSDEYNGKNYGPGDAKPRPPLLKHFASFSEAEKQNARSRIYLGIHWQFDADAGVRQGHEVGMYVFDNALQPLVGE